jgi:hypothetical protein
LAADTKGLPRDFFLAAYTAAAAAVVKERRSDVAVATAGTERMVRTDRGVKMLRRDHTGLVGSHHQAGSGIRREQVNGYYCRSQRKTHPALLLLPSMASSLLLAFMAVLLLSSLVH